VKGIIMINRKIASLALFAAISAPSAFAADVITSDGRAGGAFWGQPISAGSAAKSLARPSVVIGEVNPSDGRPGGAFWGSAAAQRHPMVASGERFVATSKTGNARPYSFLEEFNP
jgi:hypothetical protein